MFAILTGPDEIIIAEFKNGKAVGVEEYFDDTGRNILEWEQKVVEGPVLITSTIKAEEEKTLFEIDVDEEEEATA